MLDTREQATPTGTLNPHLVGADTGRLQSALAMASELCAEYLREADRPRSPRSRPELGFQIDSVDLAQPTGDLGQALQELREVWLDHAVWYHHPNYIAHLNCPVTVPAIAAEVLATTVNTAVESWDQATSAALIEKRLLRWTAAQIGFPTGVRSGTNADGVFTSGGTQSNLQALLVAREKAIKRALSEETAPSRSQVFSKLRFFATGNTHYSVARAAHLLGLDESALVKVDQDERGRIDPNKLEQALREAEHQGDLPAVVVATAGTTDRGAIDPLPEIAEICSRHRVHLHVDAAYGGALLVSPARRNWLVGIHLADSVTVDFHKGFFQPVACSAIIFRNATDLTHVNWFADYLNPEFSERLNLADVSLQTTRRFDALKLWVTLRTLGAECLGEAFDRCCDLAQNAAEQIRAQDCLELLDEPQLSTVLFSHRAAGNLAIRDRLFDSAEVIIATTTFRGQTCLKFTMLDPQMTPESIATVIDHVITAGADILEEQH
ncbi:pyridoxal phosphate-dependent decarboxylase family protein [Corynebacterium sp. A21]|uniref:pyridoxal phosphate-dependent decarboxylase family protein n=1 Tax=Corynebacterium sp. A21 TaxID=3457318 RepID=UPI003FD05BCE